MCGIVGIVGQKPVTDRLVQGLKRLEYRGYDSAGISVLLNNTIEKRRSPGKIVNLQNLLDSKPLDGTIGIAHTRWATHGFPNEENTHPHTSQQVSVVHNGIIENYAALKEKLKNAGYHFHSDTDTEVVPHLIDSFLKQNLSPVEAVKAAVRQLDGAFALGVMFEGQENLLVGARRGSPLAIGYGEGEMYLGSDAIALAHLSDRVSFLEDNDFVVLTKDTVQIYDHHFEKVTRPIKDQYFSSQMISKEDYPHFMLKEIFEQPDVIRRTLSAYLSEDKLDINPLNLPFDLADIDHITIIACGTAHYAGRVARYWFEQIAKTPVTVDFASDFRYRMPPLPKKQLAIFISQSGETADTIAAHEYAKEIDQHTIGIINVAESTLARTVDAPLMTYAGPEIGVASTKAFTNQLTVLAILALEMAKRKGTLNQEQITEHCQQLSSVPALINSALEQESEVKSVCYKLANAQDILYIGRGTNYAIALEGALKLKEITYIHAEGYAAGEMKHGPIALIDDKVPVIIISPSDDLFEKTASNMEEVIARKGVVTLLTDSAGYKSVQHLKIDSSLIFPKSTLLTAPILYTIPVQLLAYHTAVIKGTDVDQPRNLAKSVTVE